MRDARCTKNSTNWGNASLNTAFSSPFCAANERAKTPIIDYRVQIFRACLMVLLCDQLEHGLARHHVFVRELAPQLKVSQKRKLLRVLLLCSAEYLMHRLRDEIHGGVVID